jgi:hypothetical protein
VPLKKYRSFGLNADRAPQLKASVGLLKHLGNRMEETHRNLIPILISAVITAIFTIVAGVAVYYLTERSPDLRYTIVEAPPFFGEKKNMAIYRIDVSNRGKKEVEDIAVSIGFPNANIEEFKFDTPGVV